MGALAVDMMRIKLCIITMRYGDSTTTRIEVEHKTEYELIK